VGLIAFGVACGRGGVRAAILGALEIRDDAGRVVEVTTG
jgi:hypothetical protein